MPGLRANREIILAACGCVNPIVRRRGAVSGPQRTDRPNALLGESGTGAALISGVSQARSARRWAPIEFAHRTHTRLARS
jgi:hypothetical protein